MRTIVALALLALLAVSLSSCGKKQAASNDPATLAKHFVDMLAKQDFASAVKRFDTIMTGAMDEVKLRQTWAGVLGQAGAFKKQAGVRVGKEQGLDCVYVTCEFERATLDVKVVYDAKRQVSGLWILPHQQTKYGPPPYAKPASC